MSSGVFGLSDELNFQADAMRAELVERLSAAKRAGREEMTADEKRSLRELKALQERAQFASDEADRAGWNHPVLQKLRQQSSTAATGRETRTMDQNLTYRARDRPHQPGSRT